MTQMYIVSMVLNPDHTMAWETGCTLHGYTLRREGEGWLLVLRVNGRNGQRQVAFIKADTIESCFDIWYTAMHSTSIKLTWKPDQYA